MRQSGILLSITSLPSPWGIGTLGPEAFRFVDFLSAAGQNCWQMLPLGPIGLGDSPYQTLSAFGGDPLLIDPGELAKAGLLEQSELPTGSWGSDPAHIDYTAVRTGQQALLRKAFMRFCPDEAYERFLTESSSWLEDYALYRALKDHFDGAPWTSWPEDIRHRHPDAMAYWKKALARQIQFQRFQQYEFFCQWDALADYAHEKKITIIGDIPLYVPMDSAEVWSCPELFQLDEELRPVAVAGVPPDYFSEDGQLWGYPLYDWAVMERDGFSWWVRRLQSAGRLFDVVRIDHFRGLESYWAVPYGEATAREGSWIPGPGRKFVDAVRTSCRDTSFIAEDLGFLTPEVYALRDYADWPGMKILQFAFDPGGGSDYLPHTYEANCICYTGTHDNETLMQWWEGLDPATRAFAVDYLGLNDREGPLMGIIRGGMSSVAERFICPMQDWLGLGAEGRMNVPGQAQGCWTWRMAPGDASPELAEKIRTITARYGRIRP